MTEAAVRETVAALHRDHFRAVLAPLVRRTGRFEMAEEVVQEAFIAAMDAWSRDGVPDEPVAWLRRVARNRAIDRLRRSSRWADKAAQLAALPPEVDQQPEPDEIADDVLRLVFTCCHPALAPEARIALTLHTVCGLTTDEIARAFLVTRPTLQQRLVRAKRKIDRAGIPYAVPPTGELPARLEGVLRTLYLLFTEGHASTQHPGLVRPALCDEAIRLAGLLEQLLPDRAEVSALRALMMLHHARTPARLDDAGRLVRLPDQDRSRWDQAAIAAALPRVDAALRARPVSRYAIEAAIAALHAQAPSADETDWPQIAGLYAALRRRSGADPVLAVPHAVAVILAGGPEAGLAMLEAAAADARLARYPALHLARAEALERMGQDAGALQALQAALEVTDNPVERAFLEERLAAAGPPMGAPPRQM